MIDWASNNPASCTEPNTVPTYFVPVITAPFHHLLSKQRQKKASLSCYQSKVYSNNGVYNNGVMKDFFLLFALSFRKGFNNSDYKKNLQNLRQYVSNF